VNSSRSWILAGATLALGCGAGAHGPAPHEPSPVRARLASAERTTAPAELEIAGSVEAAQSATVSTRVMAFVTAVHVRLGERVERGQLLVSIDPTAAEGQAAQATGGLAQAEAALVLAQRNHERFSALAATDAASALELDHARLQLEQARGAVEQARGAVAAASSVARETRVVAPFAGRVAARLVEVGDLAAPGRPLVRLDSVSGRRLSVEVPERVARTAALAAGSRLPVALDARGELGRIEGEIVELAPGPDPATHTITVKIALAEADVATGAAGRTWIPTGARDAVLVPAAALIESGGLTLVAVRDAEGRARSRVVTTGAARADGRVEVLSGLDGDEQVLLGLGAAPAAGAPVEESAP